MLGLAGVGGVVDGGTPGDEFAVLVEGGDGDVGHGAIAGGPVPVVDAGFEEEGFTGLEGFGFLAFKLVDADSGNHHNELPNIVGVPVGAGFGLESDGKRLELATGR